MKKLLFAFMLLATIKSNGQQKSYVLDTTKHAGVYFSNEPPKMVAEYRYGNDTLYVYPSDKIKFIRIGERIYKIESPMLMEIKRESNGYWLGNTFTMDTTMVNPILEYNLINADTLPLSKKPIKH